VPANIPIFVLTLAVDLLLFSSRPYLKNSPAIGNVSCTQNKWKLCKHF